MTQQEEKRGGYTCAPNMLINGYHELHPQDKWLFVCLDHLCGKERKRALSLRYISKRTGFSPAVLIDDKRTKKPGMLNRLQDAGLIRVNLINGQYHITILDIWTLNESFYKEYSTCSDSEHPTMQPVRIPNTPVSNTNANRSETEQPRSDYEHGRLESEQNCSEIGTRVILDKTITKTTDSKNEERENNVEETSSLSELSSHTHSSSDVSSFSSGSQGGVIDPPASVGGSLFTADGGGNATSISAPNSLEGAISSDSVGNTQPLGHVHSAQPDPTNAPSDGASACIDPSSYSHSSPMGDYTKEEKHVDIVTGAIIQGDSVHTGKSGETLNNDADQACVTPMDEVREVTQAILSTTVESPIQIDASGSTVDEKGPVEVATGKETRPSKKAPKTAQQTLIESPLVEPDMTGVWTAEKVVQYAEFHNGKRYPAKQRTVQIEAARTLHRDDESLTLEQFKLAYDECNDAWWQEHVMELHVKHMQSKIKSSGMVRLYAMLHKAETRKKKKTPYLVPTAPPTVKVTTMNEEQARILAKKAILLAQEQDHEIQAVPALKNATWMIVVDWKTQGFSKPEEFCSEEQWNAAFSEMCKLWSMSKKKERIAI